MHPATADAVLAAAAFPTGGGLAGVVIAAVVIAFVAGIVAVERGRHVVVGLVIGFVVGLVVVGGIVTLIGR